MQTFHTTSHEPSRDEHALHELSLLSLLSLERPTRGPGETLQMLVLPIKDPPWGVRLRLRQDACDIHWRQLSFETSAVPATVEAGFPPLARDFRCRREDASFDARVAAAIRRHLQSFELASMQSRRGGSPGAAALRFDYADEGRMHMFTAHGVHATGDCRHADLAAFLLSLSHTAFDNPLVRDCVARACSCPPSGTSSPITEATPFPRERTLRERSNEECPE